MKDHLLVFMRLVNAGAPQELLAEALEKTPDKETLEIWAQVGEAIAEHNRDWAAEAAAKKPAAKAELLRTASGWRAGQGQGHIPPDVREEMKAHIKAGKGPTFLVNHYGISTSTATKIRQEADAEKFDAIEAAKRPASTEQPAWAIEK